MSAQGSRSSRECIKAHLLWYVFRPRLDDAADHLELADVDIVVATAARSATPDEDEQERADAGRAHELRRQLRRQGFPQWRRRRDRREQGEQGRDDGSGLYAVITRRSRPSTACRDVTGFQSCIAERAVWEKEKGIPSKNELEMRSGARTDVDDICRDRDFDQGSYERSE